MKEFNPPLAYESRCLAVLPFGRGDWGNCRVGLWNPSACTNLITHIYMHKSTDSIYILYSVQIVRGVGNATRITKFKRIFQDNPACFLFVVRISLRGSREVGEATTHHYYAYVKKTTILYFILVKLNTKHEELHRCTVKICVCSAQIKNFDRQDKSYVVFTYQMYQMRSLPFEEI